MTDDAGARVLQVGQDAVLLELDSLEAVLDLHARLLTELRSGGLPGVEEVVPAALTVLVRLTPGRRGRLARARLEARGQQPLPAGGLPRGHREAVDVPVVYDGEDLDDVARLTGLTAAEVVRRHTAAPWTVAFTGFAPGFGYLAGGDPALQVPRRATPRTSVPAGAVGLAGGFCGVYPRASPGGWQLLGRTGLAVWDAERDPPALLRPGVQVRFRAVDALPDPAPTLPDPAPTHPVPTPAPREQGQSATLEVLDPGPSTLVQDLGRPGRSDLGLAASGALDAGAIRRANRVVGNRPGAPALEVSGGLAVRVHGRVEVAVAGADAPVLVERSAGPHAGRRRATVAGVVVALDDGDLLHLGAPRSGAAAYLAVRGGLDVTAALGSTSRDVLAGVGPEPLLAGSRVPVAAGWVEAAVAVPTHVEPAPPLPVAGEPVALDVVLGPRDGWFGVDAVALLGTQDWRVTPRSNRVGARLEGAAPLARGREGGTPPAPRELPSEGTVRGALQVPPDGRPVLFGPDHPVTGGYPVVACVAAHHLDLAGQLPVGAVVRFRVLA